MKIFYIELFSIINISFLIIPLWNLKKSSIDLLSEESSANFTIYNMKKNASQVILIKNIFRNENNITEQNYIKIVDIDNNTINEQVTDWEDIERFYNISLINNEKELIICPKGKNFINRYFNNTFSEMIPENFDNNDNGWELICYFHPGMQLMVQVLLNRIKEQYIFTADSLGKFNGVDLPFFDGVFDYISYNMSQTQQAYSILALALIDSQIWVYDFSITIPSIFPKENNKTFLDYKSKYNNAYFDTVNTPAFYWISANSTSEFRSGYGFYESNANIATLDLKFNTNSPFNFLYPKNAIIKNLKMIRNTRYIYYEIEYNKNNEKVIYYGIIDIILNKILFNTNEALIKFKPLKSYSMLAFTETNAFEICAIKENNKCVDSCTSGKLILDIEKGNYCSNQQICGNYLLKNDNICINNCDENIFVSKGKECGLCKTLYQIEKPYKLINKEGCLSEKPENTYYINEDLKILDYCSTFCKKCSNFEKCEQCNWNYKLENGKCIKRNFIYIYVIAGVVGLIIILLIILFIYKRRQKSRDSIITDEITNNLSKENTKELMDNTDEN